MIVLYFLLHLFLNSDKNNNNDVDNVIVIGKKPGVYSATKEKSSFVLTKKTDDLMKTAKDPGMIFNEESGIILFSTGGFGQLSFLSLRGSNTSQVAFFIDGFPINSGAEMSTDLNALNWLGLAKIEIFKGVLPSELGIFGIGGGVNLIPNFKRKKQIIINYTIGSFGTFKLNISVQKHTKYFPLFFNLGIFSGKGDYLYFNNGGTTYNSTDDKVQIRNNNKVDKLYFTLGSTKRIHKLKTSVYVSGIKNKAGIPGAGSLVTQKSYYENYKLSGILKNEFNFNKLYLNGGVFFNLLNSTYYDPNGEVGIGEGEKPINSFVWGLKFNSYFNFLKFQSLAVILDLSKDYFKTDNQDFNRQTYNIALKYRFNSSKTFFQTSMHHSFIISEKQSQNIYGFKIGIFRKITRTISFKSNISSLYRLPSFWELYGDLGFLKGNPNLKTEKSLNTDLGFESNFNLSGFKFKTGVASFKNQTENLIQFIPNSQFVSVATNIGKADIKGIEYSLLVKRALWRLKFNATYMKAINKSEISYQKNKFLPARPLFKLFGAVRFPIKIKGFTFLPEIMFRYAHKTFYDASERKPIPDRFFCDFKINLIPIWKNTYLNFEILNVFNQIKENIDFIPQPSKPPYSYPYAISTYLGYPLPGRSIFLTITIKP